MIGAAALAAGWPRLLISGIAQPRGGSMPGSHRAHQTGRDAGALLYRPPAAPLDRARGRFSHATSLVRPAGLGVNGRWRPEHGVLIRLAAEDAAVARIFVDAAIRKRLCETTPAGKRAWLRKVRPWWGHRAHGHVWLHRRQTAPRLADPPPACRRMVKP